MKRLTTSLLWASTALLAGCASAPGDNTLRPVQQAVQSHLGVSIQAQDSEADQAAARERTRTLLAQALSADGAVELALLNHRGMQARLAELGIAQADLAQAGRLPNPGFGLARHHQGGVTSHETSVHFNLARLVATPWLRALEERRVAGVQADVTAQVLGHAMETRKAWVQAVLASESERYARQVLQATEASAELARRMGAVGNFSALQQMREQAFHAEAALNLARAEQRRMAQHERLIRQLGLWGDQLPLLRLPARLPDLPAAPRQVSDVEQQAVAQRLDLQAMRQATEQTARNLGLVRRTRFINVLELGASRETTPGEPSTRSWELSFELPLFDWGDARVTRAEAIYRQQLHRAADAAINARSEVREAYAAYHAQWAIARHQRDELVPLARRVSEENQLRYNGMLIGVFELLADARAQIAAVNGAIQSLGEFWLADADLQMALLGKPSLALPAGAPAAAAGPAADGH